jgi:hypothetical protein
VLKVYRGQQRSFVGSRKLEEWVIDEVLVEFQGSRVIEQEMVRRLHSDLK